MPRPHFPIRCRLDLELARVQRSLRQEAWSEAQVEELAWLFRRTGRVPPATEQDPQAALRRILAVHPEFGPRPAEHVVELAFYLRDRVRGPLGPPRSFLTEVLVTRSRGDRLWFEIPSLGVRAEVQTEDHRGAPVAADDRLELGPHVFMLRTSLRGGRPAGWRERRGACLEIPDRFEDYHWPSSRFTFSASDRCWTLRAYDEVGPPHYHSTIDYTLSLRLYLEPRELEIELYVDAE